VSIDTGSIKPYTHVLIVDDREPQPFVELVAGRCPIPIEFKHLKTGDFVCEDVCIERKEIGDFANSIVDKRVFRQCDRMLEEFKYPYLVIHGRIADLYSKVRPHAIIGAMVYFTKNNIPVLCLDTAEECSYAILKIFESRNKLKMTYPPRKKTKRTKRPKKLKAPKA
jgi:Fanconi anemia group M protein